MAGVSELDTTRPVEPDDAGVVQRTFLIADVRGYTRFTRERGDAEAARLAQTFAGLARDAVEARSGRVIELRGDEALAVFSSPVQALRAAVELIAVCREEMEANPDLPLLVGVGIDSGPAVPVEDGFRGAALNTAARLCSQASAGQVLVRERFVELDRHLRGIRLSPHGPAELKGFDEPVQLSEATMEDAAGPRPAGEPELTALPQDLEVDTPLIGRESELSWLRGTWRQARRGRGRVVFATGSAGIGKTRLAAELAAYVRSQGGSLSYVGAGGAAQALAVSALNAAASATRPTLLVLDDLDVLGEPIAPALVDTWAALETAPVLVVGLVSDPHAVPTVAALVERADEAGDGHRVLAPLDQDGVGRIAELYAGEDLLEVPLESITRASAGVPGRVHEVMSEWAQAEASRRLAAAAEWLAAERLDRRADLDFANNVIGLKLARLYAGGGTAAEAAPGACPYKGLASFEEGDARFFFGRERLVGELAARTVGVGMLAVVGASGSGKSSVIAAGLMPSLQAGLLPGSEHWRSVPMRPGEHPAAALEAALRREPETDERTVLVVDQFEELFTTCTLEAEREAFVGELVALAADPERAVVVLALRGDFYGHCGSYPELARLIASNQVLVGPMTSAELRRAVELPARRVGVRVESALVERLAGEVADEPGGLPLFSTALVELWGVQSGGWLRLDAHERLGGVRGAVARLAERSYEQLTEEQRVACQSLLLRLVSTGDEGTVVRRTVQRAELDLEQGPVLRFVVERLTEDRLLTANDETIEVAHEALLREWPRFQEWLHEDQQGRELREHLTQSAKRWDGTDRDTAELYRGARLSATVDWAATRQHELNRLEREFLGESRRHAELEAERQRRANRRLRILLAGVGLLLLAAIAAGIVALVLRSNAQRSATSAEAQRLGAQALVQNDLDLSLLLAREGVKLSDSTATRSNLLAALLRSPQAIGIMRPLPGRLVQISSSRSGSIFVGNNRGLFAVIDPASHRVRRFNAGVAQLSDDGARVALLNGDGSIQFAPVGPGAQTRARGTFTGHGVSVANSTSNSTFSPDLKLVADGIAVPGRPPALVVFKTSPVRFVAELPVPQNTAPYRWQAFSSDGRYLLAGANGLVLIWRVGRYGAPILSLHVPGSIADLSHDDRLLAVGGGDGSLHLYAFPSGAPRPLNGRHNGFVTGVGFSPDDRTLVTTSDDSQVLVWDVASGNLRTTLVGHRDRVYGPAFSPDGRTLYTAGFDNSVITWDLAGTRSLGRVHTADAGANPLAAQLVTTSPDGRLLAFDQINGDVLLRDARSFRLVHTLRPGAGGANTLAFSPDSRLLATETHLGGAPPACKGPLVELWDTRTGRLLGRLPIPRAPAQAGGPCADVEALAFSPDGKLLAGGDDAPVTFLWDVRSRRLVASLRTGQGVFGVAFSPDGHELAAAEGASTEVWSLPARRHLYTVNVDDGFGRSKAVAFSPDGGLLATGGGNGIVKLWDALSGRAVRHSTVTIQCALNFLQFSADGRSLLESACDGSARLFDVSTLGEVGTPFQGPAQIQSTDAVFSADGRRIIVAYDTGQAYVWDVTPSDWSRHACVVAGRNLTHDEWRFFLPDRSYRAVCPGLPAG